MRALVLAALPLALAACETGTRVTETRIIAPVSQAQTDACVAAAAQARGVEPGTVVAIGAEATAAGPSIRLSVAGQTATCAVDAAGMVRTLTFG